MSQKFPEPQFVPLDFQTLPIEEQTRRAAEFYQTLNGRRTVRDFSDEAIPFELIEGSRSFLELLSLNHNNHTATIGLRR